LEKRLELAGEISANFKAYKPVPHDTQAELIRLAKEPKRVARILISWGLMWQMAEGFLKRYAPETQVMIFGHFHRNAIQQRRGKVQICNGSFLNQLNASAVDIFEGNLEVKKLVFDQGNFQLEKTPHLILS